MTMTTGNQHFTEEELVITLKEGNQHSFQKFYERFSPALYSVIIKWINDNHTAENLLQDVFVKAWHNRHAYDPGKGRLFTWLYNIARNICIDHYRSSQYKKGKSAILSDDIA